MTTFIFCATCLFTAIASGFAAAAFLNVKQQKLADTNVTIKPLVYKWVLWNEETMSCSASGAIAYLKGRLRNDIEYRVKAMLEKDKDKYYFELIGNKAEIISYTEQRTSPVFFEKISIFVRSDQIDEFEFKTANELKEL